MRITNATSSLTSLVTRAMVAALLVTPLPVIRATRF